MSAFPAQRLLAYVASVASRHRHSIHTRAFLEVLAEVASAAHKELLTPPDSAVDDARERHVLLVTGAAMVASEAASPFVLDLDPHCIVFALDTVTDALLALSSAHAMLLNPRDACSQSLPALLPAVHAAWPSFIAAFGSDSQIAARKALERLPQVACLSGGDFLMQRFAAEAWPRMRSLLLHGTLRSAGGDTAPGAIRRTQLCVLTCISSLLSDGSSRKMLSDAVAHIANDLAALLRQQWAQPDVQARAESLLRDLSVCDADLCWLLLVQAHRVRMPLTPPCMNRSLLL